MGSGKGKKGRALGKEKQGWNWKDRGDGRAMNTVKPLILAFRSKIISAPLILAFLPAELMQQLPFKYSRPVIFATPP
jgi:hypothetical protein